MTKRLLLPLLLISASLVGACTTDNDDNTKIQNNQQEENQPNDKPNDTSETKPQETVSTVTQAEALKNVKEQLETDLAVVLPKELPLTEGTF